MCEHTDKSHKQFEHRPVHIHYALCSLSVILCVYLVTKYMWRWKGEYKRLHALKSNDDPSAGQYTTLQINMICQHSFDPCDYGRSIKCHLQCSLAHLGTTLYPQSQLSHRQIFSMPGRSFSLDPVCTHCDNKCFLSRKMDPMEPCKHFCHPTLAAVQTSSPLNQMANNDLSALGTCLYGD